VAFKRYRNGLRIVLKFVRIMVNKSRICSP
jgi:hypothetical protein